MTKTLPTLNDIANLFDDPQTALELLTNSEKDGRIYLGSQERSATPSQFYEILCSGRARDELVSTNELFKLYVRSMIPTSGIQANNLRKPTTDPSRRCPRYPDLKWYDRNME